MASDGAHADRAGSLRLRVEAGGAEIVARPEIVIVAGYTGRDRDAVLVHIGELEGLGIAPPPRVPTFYAVSPMLLTQGETLVTTEAATTGEAEACLVVDRGEMYVTVGSDHTDRAAERFDIALSKRACHKAIGSSAWRLDDVVDHWDDLQLRSFIGDEGSDLYQEGPLSSLIPPLELLRSIPWRAEPPCFVLLCGTVPTLAGIQPSSRFKAELSDPQTGRQLAIDYSIETLDHLQPESGEGATLAPAGPAQRA